MSRAKSIRLVIADDHDVVRDGLAAIISLQSDMKVVAQAVDGEEAVAAFNKHLPDVMLLDLRMPKIDGIQVVRTVMAAHPEAHIVIITIRDSDEDIVLGLKAGATGYLLKCASRNEILSAIRKASAGERYIPENVAVKLAAHVTKPILTDREMDTLQQVALGKSNKEIGAALFICEGTVKTHVKSLLAKLDAMSRTEAVAIAARRGLVKL